LSLEWNCSPNEFDWGGFQGGLDLVSPLLCPPKDHSYVLRPEQPCPLTPYCRSIHIMDDVQFEQVAEFSSRVIHYSFSGYKIMQKVLYSLHVEGLITEQ
jgi:hypothetical protein